MVHEFMPKWKTSGSFRERRNVPTGVGHVEMTHELEVGGGRGVPGLVKRDAGWTPASYWAGPIHPGVGSPSPWEISCPEGSLRKDQGRINVKAR